MSKHQPKHPLEGKPFVEELDDWLESPEGQLSIAVESLLETADVDAKNRQIIWSDGKRLSLAESAERIHADHPDFPLELIEQKLIGWLEMEFAPETYTQEQLDELDRLTEQWIEDHEKQATTTEKPPKTPHS